VGSFAIQLAHLAGAHVTGLSSSPDRAPAIRELGADQVIHSLEPSGENFDAVVEGVGGGTLGAALQRVAPFGTVVSFASTDPGDLVSFPTRSLFGRASGASLYGLRLWPELDRARSGTRDLARLADLVAAGRLRCQVGHEGSWRDAAEAITALLDRQIDGKAVLHVD
jgi:NADPH:quinone reductase-like Zn-dependent oxidoreductase